MIVIVTEGAHAGKIGTAEPLAAYGPANNRTFTVRVTFDDGSGQAELPLTAVQPLTTRYVCSNSLLIHR